MENKKYLLATDLDGTFVGDQEALTKLLQFFKDSPDEVALVYVTGRHLTSAQTLMSEEDLPSPDMLITDVGTSIYHADGLREDPYWKARMQKDWQPERIVEIASAFPSLNKQKLPDDRRVSFTLSGDVGAVNEFKKALVDESIAHSFIFSSNRDIDVLPLGAGKGNALEYALDRYAMNGVKLLIAGDSGNDWDMLSLGHPSVIVGNAQPELLEMEPCENLFHANEKCAGGIHEAWVHFYGEHRQTVR
ncbi:HAD family hydrolase [Sporosarcina sp. ACRSL]|uniref:HAD-IIB family hydrolase n=1 Tax=Sporosarcina sp. ACRSL TaxID=2918215 RepID=UPI001EF3F636|nr:HAD-IIB family hydrolase [Sporosarcina sp. ACRSL]MCG7343779.1 HAD family hydrolase [Sporosarcina sp. ACRSL]